MNKTPAERQAASRTRKKGDGFVRTTLRLDAKTIARLRRLAKRDDCPQATVIAAALVLVDNRQLLQDVKAWAAERQAATARQATEAQ